MKKLMLLTMFLIAANINANTICEGKTEHNNTFRLELPPLFRGSLPVTLTVIDPQGNLVRTRKYTVDNEWDGHSQGLMTAPGLSVKYSDSYGRIHSVTIVALTSEHMGRGWLNTAKIEACREIGL